MNNWVKISEEEMSYMLNIGGLKKSEIQLKYAQDMAQKDKEIERLNNIINNLINYIGQEWYCFDNESVEFYVAKDILNKLQELKGVDKK